MSLTWPKSGKYWRFDPLNPDAIGQCDLTGLVVKYSDLVKQMEYRGNGLVWTGWWVFKDRADKPNPQNLTPPFKVDPQPLDHPRPFFNGFGTTWNQQNDAWSTQDDAPWVQWGDEQ